MARDRVAQSVELGALCDRYGALLTEKQRSAVRLHCDEDYSFGEIAVSLGVTRQNVQDTLARTEEKLRRYERALHAVADARTLSEALTEALTLLEAPTPEGLARARALIAALRDAADGEPAIVKDSYGEEAPAHGV